MIDIPDDSDGAQLAPGFSGNLPPQIAACIAIARARSADLRCAERAFSALEKVLRVPPQAPHEAEAAALLAVVRQEAARRLNAMREAMECLQAAKEEELARREEEEERGFLRRMDAGSRPA